jgi:endogenous inhibitor of DNA gyrase (YacG/DUF329 family)
MDDTQIREQKLRSCAVCGAPFGSERDTALGGAPFCSERCRLQDLSKWFSGDYAIPAISPPLDAESQEDN